MQPVHSHHRLPEAGVDPIADARTACLTLAHAVSIPLRHETILVLVDHQRRGDRIVVVSGTEQPSAVLEVVELFTSPAAHRGEVGGVIVGTVRPTAVDGAIERADVDRWLEMSDICEQAGVELLEWFVLGPGQGDVRCPRDRLAEPPRW